MLLPVIAAGTLVFGSLMQEALPEFSVEIPKSYKEQRIAEMTEILENEYPQLTSYRPLLLAHLLTENGALAEDRHGDFHDGIPCSIGIPQINTCIHFNQNVYQYLDEHPDMREWRNQFRMYLQWMDARITKYEDIDEALRSWNRNAGTPYLTKIKGNIQLLQKLS